MSKVEDLRNIAFVGHGAVGKTTLADLLLFQGGVGSRAGSVDDGTSALDFDEEEKQHKYSISSSLVHFDHNGKTFNLIDTPGYPDFVGQAIGSLRAVETAVIVISGGAGIEVNTRRVFAEAGKAGIGRMIVLNKLDLDNIQFDEVVDSIQETFGQPCVLLNVPVGLGEEFSGVVSTLDVPDDVPDGVVVDPADVNQTVMDAIVESDEELMMRFLDGEELSPDEISGAASKAIAEGTLIPIFCLSSKTGVGVPEFADALASFALSTTGVSRTALNGSDDLRIVEPDSGDLRQMMKSRGRFAIP